MLVYLPRHLWLSFVFFFITAVSVVVSALGVTTFSPDQEVSLTLESTSPYVFTRAGDTQGLLNLYSDEVEIIASASSQDKIWLEVGLYSDVCSWVEGRDYEEIIGTNQAEELSFVVEKSSDGKLCGILSDDFISTLTDDVDEEGSTNSNTSSNPLQSDNWKDTKYATGTLTYNISAEEMETIVKSNYSFLFATDGKNAAPNITITWKTPATYTLSILALVIAIISAFLGIVTYVILNRIRRKRLERSRKLAILQDAVSTETTMISSSDVKGTVNTLPPPPVFNKPIFEVKPKNDPEDDTMSKLELNPLKINFAKGSSRSKRSSKYDPKKETGYLDMQSSHLLDRGEYIDSPRYQEYEYNHYTQQGFSDLDAARFAENTIEDQAFEYSDSRYQDDSHQNGISYDTDTSFDRSNSSYNLDVNGYEERSWSESDTSNEFRSSERAWQSLSDDTRSQSIPFSSIEANSHEYDYNSLVQERNQGYEELYEQLGDNYRLDDSNLRYDEQGDKLHYDDGDTINSARGESNRSDLGYREEPENEEQNQLVYGDDIRGRIHDDFDHNVIYSGLFDMDNEKEGIKEGTRVPRIQNYDDEDNLLNITSEDSFDDPRWGYEYEDSDDDIRGYYRG